jgi:hypothetical protein
LKSEFSRKNKNENFCPNPNAKFENLGEIY